VKGMPDGMLRVFALQKLVKQNVVLRREQSLKSIHRVSLPGMAGQFLLVMTAK